MAKAKKSSKISYKKATERAWWPLFIFFFVVILLVIGVLIYHYMLKVKHYGQIESFVFISNTGPVAPELQSQKTLAITPNSCTYTVVTLKETDTTSCNMNQTTYNTIVDSYFNDDVTAAISAANSTNQNLLGGAEKKLIVNQTNGTVLRSPINETFKTDASSFMNTVTKYVPQMSEMQY